ncbi:UNVERIFIED_CONTAM: Branched-chain-amino-acid aminotransferase-like protein 1, partial [Sesamum radiatum]
ESDGNKVVKEIIFGPGQKKYRFCKHMASHRLPGLTDELMKKGKHCILIRNPLDVLTSYNKVIPPSLTDLGYCSMVSIYSDLCGEGKPPPVIDSDLLREDPELLVEFSAKSGLTGKMPKSCSLYGKVQLKEKEVAAMATLRGLCDDLGIPFQAAMLRWESGPKPFDGMWAPYWYKNTHKSTGFEPPRKYPSPFPLSLYNLLEQSSPFYNLLKRYVRQTAARSFNPKLPVPANEKLLSWVGDEIVLRESAKVSVFDSVVQGGDAVWEGLRIYNGKIFKLEEHLD